jgi:DNA-binding response OmpR family regulator
VSYRILVADDDVGLASVVGLELERERYEVELCHDGQKAIERVLAWKPHLVVLDHNMPRLDGRSVCSRIRKSLLDTRVIMLTAAARLDDRVAGLDAGADDYVCKPFEMEELLARVRAQLRKAPRPSVEEESGLRIRLFGSFELRWGGTEASSIPWNRRQPVLLLKMLLARYDRPILSDVLEEAIWPGLDGARARASLHVAVRRLRVGLRAFGPERLHTTAGGYVLRLQGEDDLDLRRFDVLATELSGSGFSFAGLDELSALYRGELFADEPYSEWAEGPRKQVHDTFAALLRKGVARARAEGDGGRVVGLLARLAELEPTNEAAAVELAEAMMGGGDVAAARSVLDRIRKVLRDELEVGPGEAWKGLWERTK